MDDNYQKNARKIKTRLSNFSDQSFVSLLFNFFHDVDHDKLSLLHKKPWCCFLMLKWKMNTVTKKIPYK
ncbi:hypothetical protein Sbal223_0470 [Shewanella baltica OS223]|nr:hypothetical protein Sbal223_0470 [Shewanella baltica OS223]